MTKRLLMFVTVLTMGGPLTATAENVTLTSQNIRGLLSAKNAKVTAIRLEKSAAEEREGSLTRSFLPSVDLYGSQESFKTGILNQKAQSVFGAEARVNLFNGGQDKIESTVRSLETRRLQVQEQRVNSEELEKARSLYWQRLYLHERLSLLRTTLEVNKQNLASAQRRIKSGVATDSDRFEFEMKEVDLKREISETELEIVAQTRLLAISLGFGIETQLIFSELLTHDHDYENILKHSINQHEFLFKEFEIQAEQQSLTAIGSRRAWWPKLDAFAAYNEYDQRIESAGPDSTEDMRKEIVYGLKMTMSLSSGLESNREASANTKKALASQILANYQKQEVEAHLQSELAELKFLHEQVHEAEKNIYRAEQYYKITQSEYARGVKNSPDVLGASEKLFDMRHKRLEIIKNFQVSKAHILSKMGE